MTNQLLLDILKCALHPDNHSDEVAFTPDEYQALRVLAEKQNIFPLLVSQIYNSQSFLGLSEESRQQAIRINRIRQVTQMQRTAALGDTVLKLQQAGLHPVIMKGLACRSVYPVPDARVSNDEDILISSDEAENAKKCLTENGFQCGPDADNDSFETTFSRPDLIIELHTTPFPPSSPAMMRFNCFFADIHFNSVLTDVNGVHCEVLGPQLQELLLILHAFKHLVHSGLGIRQICDCMMWAEAWGNEIDYGALFEALDSVSCGNFARSVFKIASEHLGFDMKKACFPDEILNANLPSDDLLEDLLSGGVFGADSMARLHSSTITLNAYEAHVAGKKSSVLKSVFPPKKDLENRYPWLRKQPALLPVAWARRIIGYIAETNKGETDTAASIQIGNERLNLLRKLDVVD